MVTIFRSRLGLLLTLAAAGYISGRFHVERYLITETGSVAPPRNVGNEALFSTSPDSGGPIGSAFSAVPPARLPDPWREKLSIGERMALVGGDLASGSVRPGSARHTRGLDSPDQLPLTRPIPLPIAPQSMSPRLGNLAAQTTAGMSSSAKSGEALAVDPPAALPIAKPSPPPAGSPPAIATELGTADDAHPHPTAHLIQAPRPSAMPQPGQPTVVVAPLARQDSASRRNDTIRIATWDWGDFSEERLQDAAAMQRLIEIVHRFEIVAVQGIRAESDAVLPRLVELLRTDSREYDYLIGPPVGRGAQRQQLAFLFDVTRVETDRFELYTVDDPQDLLTYEPLVAWFRCKLAVPQGAFTFSLVNCRIAEQMSAQEIQALPALVAALHQDGRHEDDWILVGNLAAGPAQLDALAIPAARVVNRNWFTDLYGTQTTANILFSKMATVEFVGAAGAYDFLREYNLSDKAAAAISSYLPVWAEFSAWEGNVPGHITVD
ncbi:MAG: hypothetical protein KatS3mg111_1020 [Pirellulaceae bacterium]|nr:MAG: hypothetical protein KatS3mg111_1020 [Pirellulaceae bacterium]